LSDATGVVEKTGKDKTHQEALDRFKEASEADKTNREDALDDLKFRIGEQWPDDISRARKLNKRPCLTINRIPQFIRQVTGDIRQNKPAIKVLPVENSDKNMADVFTGIIRHIEQSSNAQAAYINAGEGAASCGMGWFRIVTEFSSDDGFDQDIKIKIGKNHFAAWCDPAAQEVDKSDARYAFVTELYSLEEFKARWPEASTEDFEEKRPVSTTTTRESDWWDGNYVRVAEYWTRKPASKEIALLEDGRVVDTSAMDGAEVSQLQIKRKRLVNGFKVCSYLMNGAEILEGPMDWAGKYIPIVFVTGEEVSLGDRVVRHGLIRFAKDPQRMFNYMRSASAEAIALQPKAPWVVTKEEIKGHEAQWNSAHIDNRPYLLFTPDAKAGGRPQRVEPPAPPTALWAEGENAAEDMHAATGIYPASLGAKSNETSGKAILARQRESDTGTFTYIDNLAYAIAHCGRQLVDLIPKIYDTERSIRILGEDDSQKFVTVNQVIRGADGKDKILNDLSAGKYDVIVTTGPSYTTKRAEAAESMMAFLQTNPQIAPLIGDLVAKNMDWPGSEQIAERLRKAAGIPEEGEDGQPAPPPPVDPLQLIQALTAKTQAEAEIVKMAATKSQADLQLQQAQMQTGVMGGVDPAQIVPMIVEGLRAELQASGAENAQTIQALQVMAQGILSYLTAPKEIIRGPDGTPTAVRPMMGGPTNAADGLASLAQPRAIALDANGRPVGMH
jgi:hypothetical protein